MRNLDLWADYTRLEVHGIFSPETTFTPRAGTWGLQGIVRVPDRNGDWVFLVTFGRRQGDHQFDESITEDGVLSWQSQPKQRLNDDIIHEFIRHDERVNSIHLFLRTTNRNPAYTYFGRLGYLTHDSQREQPVYFQWQLLDWPAPAELLQRTRLTLVPTLIDVAATTAVVPTNRITLVDPPPRRVARLGVSTREFRQHKTPDYAARDQRNRQLGRRAEELVLTHERDRLRDGGRDDLASQIVHVSAIEGDAAGYDIRSFELDGRARYIEVKATEGDASTSFFISANEVAFSEQRTDSYYLYRLHKFNVAENSARMFILNGDIRAGLHLTPTVFRAALIADA
jgi:hypothetical protein